MAVNLTVNGVSYSYPELDDENWGAAATGWAQAVTAGMLQKAGGTFTLTADVNFGATYGLIVEYLKSNTSNVASTGEIRLANTDKIVWRNAANSDNLLLEINAADNHLLFNGFDISAAAGGNVVGPGSSTDNAVARFNGTGGQNIQNSGVIIDDSNNVTGVAALTATTVSGTTSVTSPGFVQGEFKQLVTYTASGSYTPSAGVTKIKVTVVGGGGGGGGIASGTDLIGSAGGGAGGVSIVWKAVSALSVPVTVTVGAGGAGASAGDNAGSAGGTSSFGSYASATGGSGGQGASSYSDFAAGGAAGVGSLGDINLSGDVGNNAIVGTGMPSNSGFAWQTSGNMFAGTQRMSTSGMVSDGASGISPGGGASGNRRSNAGVSSARGGQDGADGIVWIEEYY